MSSLIKRDAIHDNILDRVDDTQVRLDRLERYPLGNRLYVYASNYDTLQAAIEAAQASTHKALAIDRDFTVTETTTINVSGLIVVGFGRTIDASAAGGTFNVLYIDAADDVEIHDLIIVAAGDRTGVTDGAGIYAYNSDRLKITGCYVSNHAQSGIKLHACDGCNVSGNKFTDAAVITFQPGIASASQDIAIAADVAVQGGGSNNVIIGNVCSGGGGYGVSVQTVSDDEISNKNKIIGNEIGAHTAYGIMVYRNSQAAPIAQYCYRNVVQGNTIEGITGGMRAGQYAAIDTDLVFGAGIYIQGAEDTVVSGNSISDCNSLTNNELLAPGAIGCSNVSRVAIVGNTIDDVSWYGVFINDAVDLGAAVGGVVIANNEITNIGKAGVSCVESERTKITGNFIDTCATYGIRYRVNAGTFSGLTIQNNSVYNSTNIAMSIEDVDDVICTGNLVVTGAVHGISLSNCDNAKVNDNHVDTITTRGIQFDADCGGLLTCQNNTVISCGVGLQLAVPVLESGNILSNTANYGSTYVPWRVLTDADATPDVLYGATFYSTPTNPLTITNFTSGYTNQIVTIRATNANTTVQHGASILLSGGANFAMASNDTLTIIYNGTVWVELSRKV